MVHSHYRATRSVAVPRRYTPVDYPELVRSFVRHGADAVPSLTVLARDRNPVVRNHTFAILGALGPVARSALPVIRDVMQDPVLGVQGAAAYAWTRVSIEDEAALISVLRTALPGGKAVLVGFLCERGEVRWAAARAIAGMGAGGAPAVPALPTAASDPSHSQEPTPEQAQGHPARVSPLS